MTNRTECDDKELQALLWDSVNAIDPVLLDALDSLVATKPVTPTEEDSDIFLSPEEIEAIFGEIEDEDIIF